MDTKSGGNLTEILSVGEPDVVPSRYGSLQIWLPGQLWPLSKAALYFI